MRVYTTEITSDKILSDNPIHQRLLKPYILMQDKVFGDLLEVGCGEGRGVELLYDKVNSFTAIDKNKGIIDKLSEKYTQGKFIASHIPPFHEIPSNSFDTVISFQVIEHIRKDMSYLKEIYRVLKPGGNAYITTPNIKKTLTRNPWHEREYTAIQLQELTKMVFDEVETLGIDGNEKVYEYYNRNKESVKRITRYDVLNLQYKLPSWLLRIPYDMLNRLNRKGLQTEADELVASISHKDYLVSDNPDTSLDLYYILKKK